MTYARTTSRTLPTSDSLGSLKLPSLRAGEFVKLTLLLQIDFYPRRCPTTTITRHTVQVTKLLHATFLIEKCNHLAGEKVLPFKEPGNTLPHF